MLAYSLPCGPPFSRRALLLAAAAATGCARRRGRGFPGYAFVADSGERTVSAVDLNTFTLARQIGLDSPPSQVLTSALRPAALVLSPETGVVWEIDAAKLAAVRKTRLRGPAVSMCQQEDGKSLWVLQPRALVRLDGLRLRPVQTIALPGTGADFDLSSAGRAAVICPGERRLALVKLDSGTVEHWIDTGPEPSMVRYQSDGRQVIVGSRADRTMTIFDTAAGRISVRLPLPVEPAHCCFDSSGGQLFVTGPGMDVVVIVYPYQTEVGETILAGSAPDGVAVSSTPSYLFVANPVSGTVTVLDIDTRKLVASVAVGQEPRHILVTPDNQYALVLNRKSGNVAVLRIPALTARRHRTDPPPLFTMVPVGAQPVSGAVVAVS